MTDAPHLLYMVTDAAACITINREARKNALSPEAIALFHDHLDAAEADTSVRCVLIRGAGPRAFCTGADLGSAIKTDGDSLPTALAYARLLHRLYSFPKPTVAMVRGYCLAGGMGLMLACDMVLADAKSRFGTPEVNVGLFPMMIGALIFRNVPRKKAMEMILTGRMIEADEALSMGLVTRLHPAEALETETRDLLSILAGKSPIGLRLGKEAFASVETLPFDKAVDSLAQALTRVIATQDAAEGLKAFMEKRAPEFTGT
ncbi:enoyl-CoA hydratase/isomerase family protein [Desulfoluna spongiiphila]|uniref:Enoyl-CoA hydratase/carnithine racemase n=1 Tax=Desulfoluna spongiiphila TaxID=419481 RepID=A0A1G5GRX2_9BACT|nr:enoyl-CoA hydratase-related protein [Desulfoluna spongiiphila]SCY54244.1 Enoyl-CoA hydratase/carnithine racemase [Desulfoluna spongiiphila]